MKRAAAILLFCFAAICGSEVAAVPTSPSPLEFFEQRIRPILANECYECHGTKKHKGGLRVDFRDGLLKGGESGPALIPGNAKKSLLLRAISHENPDDAMPKDRPKLGDSVIADFVAWVDQGAVDPRDQPPTISAPKNAGWATTFAARKDWWSFKPVLNPAAPSVTNAGWSQHPVDRFLLAKMESANLQPAAPADRRTLLRRVTFVLTGLPPTTEELHVFLDDASPDAYAKVVERLLASPRFGEHWARHWMDLVRFAETHGSESDPEIPNAWRYRDYLIRAFNADVPFDQLIREHLAGDLLAKPRFNEAEGINESLLGLAHLRLVEHGFQPVDTLDEQVKTVDSQIDVVSKAFQGLTTSCARCHDHKFDPISQRDYYALYGIFASSRPTHLTVDAPGRLRVHRDELEKLKRSIRTVVAQAWETSARQLAENLAGFQNGEIKRVAIPGDEESERMVKLGKRIDEINNAGRAAVLQARGVSNPEGNNISPIAAWTFDGDTRDSIGGLHGELHDGAVVRNGRLVLDGKGAFLRTTGLARPLREKTLEAWVTLASLDQRGGGVFSVESKDGSVFDSIVFAERESRKWMAGSDFSRRTKDLGGEVETASPSELVHLAIVYRTNNSIEIFRNGIVYGASYSPSGDGASLRTFDANTAHILIGLRHTGGSSAFFAGEIEEARLYDRALAAKEISSSFKAGPGLVTPNSITQALTTQRRDERDRLLTEVAGARSNLEKNFPNYAPQNAARSRRLAAFRAAATNENHPLKTWFQLREKSGEAFASEWQQFAQKQEADLTARKKFNADTFRPAWDFTGDGVKQWFRYGVNPPEVLARPGEFAIEPEGERIFGRLLPAGVVSHRLSQKHNGVFASPRFQLASGSISVRVVGGKGARVRLISDNYPIGQGNIFPQANLSSDAPTWVRLDTAYRKGSMVYLELATAEDVTSRDRSPPGAGGRSFFGIERIVFHEGGATPKEEITPLTLLTRGAPPKSADELAARLHSFLTNAVFAWRSDTLSEEQRLFLEPFLRDELLPNSIQEIPALATLVSEYRRLENQIPVPRRAPGVLESIAYDAPLLARGDHLKPLDPVPRAYLQLVSSNRYETDRSGRLELANEIASAANPLTARVLVNRLWHHIFGRGLVATVDNFGRLGDKPSHPELLDFLAVHFVEHGWSAKELIRFLVTTRAYQMSGEAPGRALEIDPADELLSHARVRRLEAESIRDSLLAVSGRLDPTMFGPGANALAASAEQKRRSIYLMVRRNFLSPFLEAFDFPRPFSTLGRRETTNVPAQSLALLNDPFVIEQAAQWAESVTKLEIETDPRIRRMFEMALGRLPNETELVASRAYLSEMAREQGPGKENLAWRDFAQSLFNLKEFIYVR